MKINLTAYSTKIDPSNRPIEIVERKGIGHPDTLSDALAEHLSVTYAYYTLSRFGAILRHQFDKTGLMCGRSKVSFGHGEQLEPIRVLLNGRASARLGNEEIPVQDMLVGATRDFFRKRFPMLDPINDFRIIYEVRHGLHSTTGGVFGDKVDDNASIHYRFHPRTLADLPETHRVESNDTSLGCSWFPYTPLEQLVLNVESTLNGSELKTQWPWLGTDIKIMATRRGDDIFIVVAAPILSRVTFTADDYFARVELVRKHVLRLGSQVAPQYRMKEVIVNSGDDLKTRKLYLNLTGSSIESGDEGLVGRGNRMGGLIAPFRPYTMEGLAGKNPRYHVGKVYSAAAFHIAQTLFDDFSIGSNVFLVNRMAEPLSKPWYAIVETNPGTVDEKSIQSVAENVLSKLDHVTDGLLKGKYPLF
jgi:S-adenosylmethionine synthetase